METIDTSRSPEEQDAYNDWQKYRFIQREDSEHLLQHHTVPKFPKWLEHYVSFEKFYAAYPNAQERKEMLAREWQENDAIHRQVLLAQEITREGLQIGGSSWLQKMRSLRDS